MDLHPKFGSDVEADDTTNMPIGYSETYYSQKKGFMGRAGKALKAVLKMS